MKLAVIIVSYNVRYFLEQALQSIGRSKVDFDYEVYVVDNASADGSPEMVQNHFPQVKLLLNEVNLGFSKANNRAIRETNAEYILLLNPDTIIQEDTLQKIVDFMDGHPDAGALGVKMLDGKGHYLPESKRGLPTPNTAFYKMTGLYKLFPKSRKFGRYYMGYLSPDEVNEVEVLSGACMLLRRSVLEKVGLLDESFFMYGEDIDLSYRITQAGYRNYYFPKTRIIHFKGESTRKESFRYVIIFYRAMIYFVQKHFSGTGFFVSFIRMAIWIRASLAAAKRALEAVSWYLVDTALIVGGMFGLKWLWENYVKVNENIVYPDSYLYFNFPLYTLLWIFACWLSGVYDRPLRFSKILFGLSVGTLFIAAVYGFLPMEYRSSRGMIVSGYIWAVISMCTARWIWYSLRGNGKTLYSGTKRVVVAGSNKETVRITNLMQKAGIEKELLGFVSDLPEDNMQEGYLGPLDRLPDIEKVLSPDEVIFSTKQMRTDTIMHYMALLGSKVTFKIAAEGSAGIIGSDSSNDAGDIYTIEVGYRILLPEQQRYKRLFDILLSLVLLMLSPLLIFILPGRFKIWRNIFQVLFNKKSWVGYSEKRSNGMTTLPVIKPGVLTPLDIIGDKHLESSIVFRILFLYAREYSIGRDIQIIRTNWRKLAS